MVLGTDLSKSIIHYLLLRYFGQMFAPDIASAHWTNDFVEYKAFLTPLTRLSAARFEPLARAAMILVSMMMICYELFFIN